MEEKTPIWKWIAVIPACVLTYIVVGYISCGIIQHAIKAVIFDTNGEYTWTNAISKAIGFGMGFFVACIAPTKIVNKPFIASCIFLGLGVIFYIFTTGYEWGMYDSMFNIQLVMEDAGIIVGGVAGVYSIYEEQQRKMI